jgi:hypothetical protein
MGPTGKILRKLLGQGTLDSYISRLYAIVEERQQLVGSKPENISRVLQLSSLLAVYDPLDMSFIRLGNDFDGGYVVVDTLPTLDSVLSLGVGTDISFEAELSKHVSRIDFYDHTVHELPFNLDNSNFMKLGIGGLAEPGFITLDDALCSFPKGDNILLKMDIESSEWSVLANSSSGVLSRFQQVVIEFHGLFEITSQLLGQEILKSLIKLNESHKLVHLHVNNYEPVRIIAGVPIPNVLEATYLRSTETVFREFSKPRGMVLNHPNNPLKLDITTQISF